MIGWHCREVHAAYLLRKLLKKSEKNLDILSIHVEKNSNTFDIFNSKTNQFIVNVKNKQEMIDHFKNNHPTTTVIINKDSMKVFDELL